MKKLDSERYKLLRQRAEKILQQRGKIQISEDYFNDVTLLLEELSIHQIELEMQNEALQQSQELLEASKERYANLYDYAPVAYLTFDKNSRIIELNRVASQLLGTSKANLISRPFLAFVDKKSRSLLYDHLDKTFNSSRVQLCEVIIKNSRGQRFHLKLQSIAFFHDEYQETFCRSAVIDTVELKEHRLPRSAPAQEDEHLLGLISELSFELDLQGTITFANQALEQITGYDFSDTRKGLKFSDILLPEDRQRFNKQLDILRREEFSHSSPYKAQTKSGRSLVLALNLSLVLKNKEVCGFKGVALNLTHYFDTQQKVKQNEARFQALIRNSSDVISLFAQDNRAFFVSANVQEMTGFPADSYLKESASNFIHPQDKARVIAAFEQVKQNPAEHLTIEYRGKHKGGHWLHLESILVNHIDKPSIEGIVVNTRDISERKAAELQEKNHKEQLLFLNQVAMDFVGMTPYDDIYAYIGERLQELVPNSIISLGSYCRQSGKLCVEYVFGLEGYEDRLFAIFGKKLTEICIKLDRRQEHYYINHYSRFQVLPEGIKLLTRPLLDAQTCEDIENMLGINKLYYLALVKQKQLYGYVLILTRHQQELGDSRLVETFLMQATEALRRRTLENELIGSKNKAEEADRLKSAFLANISHEIRTPLNAVQGFSQLLKKPDLSNEKRQRFTDIINANITDLLKLMDDIMDLASLESDAVELHVSRFSVNQFLRDLLARYERRRDDLQKDVELILELPDIKEDKIYADIQSLQKVLINLMDNALKFTHTGSISFGCKLRLQDTLLFYVKDTGIGISKEKQANIFKRFRQADERLERKFGGTGLGLAISKGLVNLLGGEIRLESEPGKGSDFYFSIPYQT